MTDATPPVPLSPDDVQRALDALLPGTQLRFFTESTATSQMAADQIGCALGQIVKSLCFFVQSQPVLVLASGDTMMDDRKLAALYNVGRKQVRVARPEECIATFGYAPGGVPPIGHRDTAITRYMETALQRYDTVYAAGGAHNAIFEVALADLVRVANATWAELRRDPTPDTPL